MNATEYEAKVDRVEMVINNWAIGAYKLYRNRDLAHVFVAACHDGEQVDRA